MARYIQKTDCAKLIRPALKEAFPGTKFSVRCERGSSIRITWTDGPTRSQVEMVAKKFEGATFDGMQDLREYHTSVFNGEEVRFGSDFIFCERGFTEEFLAGVAASEINRWYWENGEPTVKVVMRSWGATLEGDIHARPGTSNLYGRDISTLIMERAHGIDAQHNCVYPIPASTPIEKVETQSEPIAPMSDNDNESSHTVTHEGMWTWVAFTNKPSDDTLTSLKGLGFRWSKKRSAWYASEVIQEAVISQLIAPQPVESVSVRNFRRLMAASQARQAAV